MLLTIAAEAVLGKTIDSSVSQIVRRVAQRRIKAFSEKLAEALQEEIDSAERNETVDELLERVDRKPELAEAMHEAYCAAVLGRSDLGARSSALLTAKLVIDDRPPDDTERGFWGILPQFTDADLRSFASKMLSISRGDATAMWRIDHEGDWILLISGQSFASTGIVVTMPEALTTPALGQWASHFTRAGLIRTMHQFEHEEGADCEGNSLSTLTVHRFMGFTPEWTIWLPHGLVTIAELVERADSRAH